MEYLNRDRIEQVSHESFQRQQPYPWVEIGEILTHEGHDLLRQTLPDASMFDRKVGVKRAFGQGYHDRYILHYHPGLDLAEPWQEFVAELHGKTYEALVRRMFGLGRGAHFVLTLEWYYAWQGCGVSPHCDARRKLGTHIFYFNTEADWDSRILESPRRWTPGEMEACFSSGRRIPGTASGHWNLRPATCESSSSSRSTRRRFKCSGGACGARIPTVIRSRTKKCRIPFRLEQSRRRSTLDHCPGLSSRGFRAGSPQGIAPLGLSRIRMSVACGLLRRFRDASGVLPETRWLSSV